MFETAIGISEQEPHFMHCGHWNLRAGVAFHALWALESQSRSRISCIVGTGISEQEPHFMHCGHWNLQEPHFMHSGHWNLNEAAVRKRNVTKVILTSVRTLLIWFLWFNLKSNIVFTLYFLYHAGRDLYYKAKEGSRLVLRNRREIECALKECHDAPGSGGHKGVNITLRKVEETYHWKALTVDVRNWVTDSAERIVRPQ